MYCILDADYNMGTKYAPIHIDPDQCGYEYFLHEDLNTPADVYSLHLPNDTLTLSDDMKTPDPMLPYIIETTASDSSLGIPSMFFVSIISRKKAQPGGNNSQHSIFGCCFGVLFCDTTSAVYGYSLSGEKLFLWYSVPKKILLDQILWKWLDATMHALLPGYLPFQFVYYVATLASRVG